MPAPAFHTLRISFQISSAEWKENALPWPIARATPQTISQSAQCMAGCRNRPADTLHAALGIHEGAVLLKR